MPAVSKAQQKFFGIVRAIQKGEMAATTPETAKAASDMKKKDVKDFASTKHKGLPKKKLEEIHKQAHTPHEVPSKNLKGLVKKAVKRIDTDVDGDTDHNDKKKGELGEFIPGVGNKRLYSTTGTKTAKEAYYGGEEQRKKDEKKKKIDAFMDRAMPKRTFDQMGRETDRRTGKLKEEDNFIQKKKILKRAKPLHKHLYKNLHKKDMSGDVNEVYSNSDASRAEKYSRDDKEKKQFAKNDKRKKFGKFVKDVEAVRGKRKGMRGTSKGKWGTFNKGVFTPDN
jgi:hypothetical protein